MASAAASSSQPVQRIANRAVLLDYFSNKPLTCRLSVKCLPNARCLWMGLSLILTTHPNCDGLTRSASEPQNADAKSDASQPITEALNCEEVTIQLPSELIRDLIGYDIDKNETNVRVLNVRFEWPRYKYQIDISEFEVTVTFFPCVIAGLLVDPELFQQFVKMNLPFLAFCKSEGIRIRYVTEMNLNDHVEALIAAAADLSSEAKAAANIDEHIDGRGVAGGHAPAWVVAKLPSLEAVNSANALDDKPKAPSASASASEPSTTQANVLLNAKIVPDASTAAPQVPDDPIRYPANQPFETVPASAAAAPAPSKTADPILCGFCHKPSATVYCVHCEVLGTFLSL
jgi:hypothetical protein